MSTATDLNLSGGIPSLGHMPRILGQAMCVACMSLPKRQGACIQVFAHLGQLGFAEQLSTEAAIKSKCTAFSQARLASSRNDR